MSSHQSAVTSEAGVLASSNGRYPRATRAMARAVVSDVSGAFLTSD